MAIVIDGQKEEIPGITSVSFVDDPTLAIGDKDCRPRRGEWIRGIVLHTTKGIPGGTDRRPQRILPGLGSSVDAGHRSANCWASDGRAASAHLIVDFDGTVSCCADLERTIAYHAGPVNKGTIGVEIYQGSNAELYSGQLDVVVLLVDWLTRRFGIQRQMPAGYLGPVERLELGADNFVGVFGHRDASGNRGRGDPGDEIFTRLRAAGYEAWDIDSQRDITAWKGRQAELGLSPVDGIPGPKTVMALAAAGHPSGQWVRRPGDGGAAVA